MVRRLFKKLKAEFGAGRSARSLFNPPGVYWSQSYGTPLDSKPNGKVVVFGLPKSGNAWMVSLIADCCNLPGVEPVLHRNRRGVGICHWAFRDEFLRRDDFLHGVYLMRDLRDIVVSFFHYAQTDHFRKARPEFHYHDIESFYYEWFLSRMVTAYRWHTHAEEYAALGVPVVRYEVLKSNPAGELERLLLRWGLPVEPSRIRTAVEANVICRLRQTGKQLDVFVPPTHFRKGGSNYRDELPAQVLRDINTRFAALLARWGYVDR